MTDQSKSQPLRFLFALPGFHAEERGAEVALLSVADELAGGGDAVTVIGSGPHRDGPRYDYRQIAAINRRKFERFPTLPPFRSDTAWEDATFAFHLLKAFEPADFDVTVTCNFPFTHWALRRGGRNGPRHIYVTQNGNWPAISDKAEYRLFHCDGLVCTNPDFEAEAKALWPTALIPNGINPDRYRGVAGDRAAFRLPADKPIILMVSALIDTKRVMEGMRAAAPISDAHFVVAGDGPLRDDVAALANQALPGRFTRLSLSANQMPQLYRSVDCFLHMSLLEAFGNVYVEAMASGLPIVAQDSPRVRWIVGDRPTLCDTTNTAAVTDALRRGLALGQGAPDPAADRFAWSEIAKQYRAFAARILAS